MEKDNITYNLARENKELRQIYLDKIMQDCPNSVESLVYDSSWHNRDLYADKLVYEGFLNADEEKNGRYILKKAYFIVMFSPKLVGVYRKHPIFISDKGFEINSEANFLSSVLDHESRHTNDLMHGMKLLDGFVINNENIGHLNPETIINLREARAYLNQLRNFKKRGVNDSYFKEWVRWRLAECEKALYSITPKTEAERHALNCF
ncbi:MAG: hypothetical protein Q8N63_06900 [Nanoarchaeota archaeon]|nr:hypothetical protein [Nanoarchaeota archaeon]